MSKVLPSDLRVKTIGLGIFCVLLAGAGRAWGQSVLSGKQNPVEQANYYARIPFESIKGIPVIPVEIGGKTYRFMLDTGAPTLLSDKLSKQLGLKPLTKLDVQDANAQSDSVQAVLLPSLKVGGLNFVNQPVLVGNPPFLFDCLGVQGILGSNFLRSSIVQFSYPTRTITIASDATKLALDASTAAEMLVEPTQSLPIIGLCFTGKDVAQRDMCEQLLFDTGADTFYDLATAHLEGLGQIKALTVQSQAEGGDNMSFHGVQKPTVQYQALVPELAINGARFRNVTTTTTPDNNSRLGNALLKHGLVTVDYKNHKFYFAPFTSAGVDLQGENRRSLNPTLTAGKLSVGIIWSKKLAQQIAVGDQILSVDGVSCEQLSTCDIINHKYPAVRTGSRLKIKTKQGQTKEVVLAAE